MSKANNYRELPSMLPPEARPGGRDFFPSLSEPELEPQANLRAEEVTSVRLKMIELLKADKDAEIKYLNTVIEEYKAQFAEAKKEQFNRDEAVRQSERKQLEAENKALSAQLVEKEQVIQNLSATGVLLLTQSKEQKAMNATISKGYLEQQAKLQVARGELNELRPAADRLFEESIERAIKDAEKIEHLSKEVKSLTKQLGVFQQISSVALSLLSSGGVVPVVAPPARQSGVAAPGDVGNKRRRVGNNISSLSASSFRITQGSPPAQPASAASSNAKIY